MLLLLLLYSVAQVRNTKTANKMSTFVNSFTDELIRADPMPCHMSRWDKHWIQITAIRLRDQTLGVSIFAFPLKFVWFFVLRNNLWLSVLFVTIYAYLRSKPSTYSKTLQWANGHCNLSAVSFELFINKQTDHSSNFHLCFSEGLGVNRHKFVQAFCLTNNKMSQWDRKRDIVAWHIKCCQANKLLFSDSEAGASYFFFIYSCVRKYKMVISVSIATQLRIGRLRLQNCIW